MDEFLFMGDTGVKRVENDRCRVYRFRNERGEGTITIYEVFLGVTLSYNDFYIRYYDSVKLPDKPTTAVIGPSDSGKTTLCNLIARFWDVDSGSVKIGGRDVREYTLESLMEQISMVFQNVYLFADTIENNIKFGRPDATHEEVVASPRGPSWRWRPEAFCRGW